MIIPSNNLPLSSQPWGREIQKKLQALEAQLSLQKTNSNTVDSQLQSSYKRLDQTVRDLGTINVDISNIEDLSNQAIAESNEAIAGLNSLGSPSSPYPISANNVTSGVMSQDRVTNLISDLSGKADKSGTLAQFASTTSAELATLISNETGSGSLVFGTSPTISTPALTLSSTTSTTAGRLAQTGGQLRLGNGTTALTFSDDSSLFITQEQVSNLTTVLAGKASTTHASTHAFGGSDAITLAQSQVTNLTNDLAAKAPLASPTFTGTVSGITKSMVGLGNVDNTSDVNKPVSSATQTALNLKANLESPAFTGTVSGITAAMVGLGNVDNTSDANKPVSSATQTALNLKANIANPTFTGTVSGITATMVGLGNVDNTSDANKPVSTATQTALNLKANSANAVFTGTFKTPLTVAGYVTTDANGFLSSAAIPAATAIDGGTP